MLVFIANLELDQKKRFIAGWLFAVATFVFIMVVLGGVTRLTHSGLSMVTWEPFTGWLPPLNQSQWEDVFFLYKQYPEFKKINYNMTLIEFKKIFWLEFLHRLWGRIIGLVYFIPFVFFIGLGWVSNKLKIHLCLMLTLGAFQGFLGWFMVKSGLVERPDVSQYRLAAHLCLAFIIFGYLLATAFFIGKRIYHPPSMKNALASKFLVGIIFVTIFSGALVAGLDAGFAYNTFPLMDGALIPDGLFEERPFYLNFFESVITVQFQHRMLALTCIFSIFIFWRSIKKQSLPENHVKAVNYLLIVAIIQFVLGISTLVLGVPLLVAVFHQAGALVLFGVAIWVLVTLHSKEVKPL